MRNIKKMLVPVIALLSICSCYDTEKQDKQSENVCPAEKVCTDAKCVSLDVTYENGDAVSDTLYLLYDSNYTDSPSNRKKLVARSNIEGASITFSSSNSNAVSVSNNGLITALMADKKVVITVNVNNVVKREFTVYTCGIGTYFTVSSNKITGCRDIDVEELVLPTEYTSVSQNLLNDLPRLKKLVIPEGYTTFARDKAPATADCKLEELHIPSTLTSNIGITYGFDIPLNYLRKVVVSEDNPNYKTYDEQLLCYFDSQNKYVYITKIFNNFDGSFTDDMINEIKSILGDSTYNVLLSRGCGNGLNTIKTLNIPNSLLLDDHGAFTSSSIEVLSISRYYSSNSRKERSLRNNMINCENLREVRFNDDAVEGQEDVFSIVDGALYSADGTQLILGTVNGKISENATTIGYYAFCGRNFTNTKFKIPSNITTICCEAFADTNLGKVYIPQTATIEEKNFVYKNAGNYDTNYNSDITATRAKGGLELNIDTTTAVFTEYIGTFAFSNPALEIYDGSETDRGTDKRLIKRAVAKFTFNYAYNISAEEFDAL